MCLFILFSTLQNKQTVSKMLKNKVAYVMFRTKAIHYEIVHVCGYCVYVTCIHLLNNLYKVTFPPPHVVLYPHPHLFSQILLIIQCCYSRIKKKKSKKKRRKNRSLTYLQTISSWSTGSINWGKPSFPLSWLKAMKIYSLICRALISRVLHFVQLPFDCLLFKDFLMLTH